MAQRESTLNYEDAQKMVSDFISIIDPTYFEENCVIEESAASCSGYPCPEELHTWSGTVNAIYIYDTKLNEEIYSCAYWQHRWEGFDMQLQELGYNMEQSISGYWRLLDADGNLIHDDSACEDVYDEESAYHLFRAIIEER